MNTTKTHVAIAGGGLAGAWLGYRLAQRQVPVALVTADTPDLPTVSHQSLAVLSRRLLDIGTGAEPAAELLADTSTTQHPELETTLRTHAHREFDELAKLLPFMDLGDLVLPQHPVPRPRLGAGKEVLTLLLERFRTLGGTLLPGRITDLATTDGTCHGLHYDSNGEAHRLAAHTVVVATGGISGLFTDGVAGPPGCLLGAHLRHGGVLADLEYHYRFALGDLTHRRPLYPFDLGGARLLRNGEPAAELEELCAGLPPRRLDHEVFQQYWRENLGVPHRAELAGGAVELGPVRGFSMGGIAAAPDGGPLGNVHAVGEARHDLAADCIVGVPWVVSLATGGMLADRLAEREPAGAPEEFAPRAAGPGLDPELYAQVRRRLARFQDHRFRTVVACDFVGWCREIRRELRDTGPSRTEDIDLLILAEACTEAALARTESRGFFFRADRPAEDPGLEGLCTRARYDRENDCVLVDLVHRKEAS
jgi:succinate dehydrogenase/fumarate reductase flavoprotein subunit